MSELCALQSVQAPQPLYEIKAALGILIFNKYRKSHMKCHQQLKMISNQDNCGSLRSQTGQFFTEYKSSLYLGRFLSGTEGLHRDYP